MDLQPICDLIEPQLVGKTIARCLHTVQYPSLDGYYVFDNVYYMPIVKTYFQTITVEVLNKLGDRVSFPDSVNSLVAVLHFRRRSYGL